jgi:hypothetical protein
LRLIGRTLLWTFAVIGFCVSLVAAGIGVLHFFPVGVDPTRVVAVVPNPGDKQAAVVYLHHFADHSVDLVAVKLIRPPFPAVSAPIQQFGDLLAVRGAGIDGWAFGAAEAWKTLRETWLPFVGMPQGSTFVRKAEPEWFDSIPTTQMTKPDA